ncbi:hypothetical protein BUALT_Bualt14G0086400 [Buddleja alternifolia]|uniref:RING-type E3 ubiquitin transferase n=1 Tax=Buddleja alternifolia TaxID=168488 RepID=A0AAV6WT30_9LAMI|nr:hypothetical protein BUALT_Bualt14G0086400 [Buddleja alternifolia]
MKMANALISASSSSSVIGDDSFEDACSICLEPFSSLDPPSITKCKHEYHLHCIIEWSQRSYECPICLQRLVLNDPTSQELLAGAHSVKNLKPSRNFPVNQDNEVDNDEHPVGDSDLEQRIRQRFTAITTRARNMSRRRRQMSPPQVLPSVPTQNTSNVTQINGSSSEFTAFSESLKSKISTASTRYKESISKSTRGLKEKLLARNDSVKELGKGVQREMNAGIAGIARMIERLDITQKRGS